MTGQGGKRLARHSDEVGHREQGGETDRDDGDSGK